MYLSRSSLVFYILKEKQNSYSILFSKAEPFLIISQGRRKLVDSGGGQDL